MTNAEIYNRIGAHYQSRRQEDPRLAAQICGALIGCQSLLNVGAGSGSYEPKDLAVVAVEPSSVMIAQRPPTAAPVVMAVAEQLPFGTQTFDAGLAVLTTHHWDRADLGIRELQRVTGRQVVVTWDPDVAAQFWLVRDYLPEIIEREASLATLDRVCELLGHCVVHKMPVPHDCLDGFLGAYWRRPEAYLEESTRRSISGFALLDQQLVTRAMSRLADDLQSRQWHRMNEALLAEDQFDLGYRMVVAARSNHK